MAKEEIPFWTLLDEQVDKRTTTRTMVHPISETYSLIRVQTIVRDATGNAQAVGEAITMSTIPEPSD